MFDSALWRKQWIFGENTSIISFGVAHKYYMMNEMLLLSFFYGNCFDIWRFLKLTAIAWSWNSEIEQFVKLKYSDCAKVYANIKLDTVKMSSFSFSANHINYHQSMQNSQNSSLNRQQQYSPQHSPQPQEHRRESLVKPTWQNVCPGEVPFDTLDKLNQLSNGEQQSILHQQQVNVNTQCQI